MTRCPNCGRYLTPGRHRCTRPHNLFGPASAGHEARGGGILPTYRPHYPASVARALHALAESKPDSATYAREKARILGDHE